MSWYYDWKPYVPVAVRRKRAMKKMDALRKKGANIQPISINGRKITKTFWGEAWCNHLESFSDYENRLPRGRTYVRNGSVMDLQLGAGTVAALVSGSRLYRISVAIKALPRPRWQAVVKECAGKIDSLVELLQGKFSRGVMEVLIRPQTGLFPSPKEISFECSCPDWAGMCKHVAATLYGVGARLDKEPELFFRLRRVDQMELLTAASRGSALARGPQGRSKRIAESTLADVFGIDIDAPRTTTTSTPARARKGTASRSAKKTQDTPGAPPEPDARGTARRRRDAVRGRGALPARRRPRRDDPSAVRAGGAPREAGRRRGGRSSRP